MTKEEFQSLVAEYKEKGMSNEDMAMIFGKMFQDDALDRNEYEACLNAIGFELSEEYKQLPDEELKAKAVVKADSNEEKPEEGKEPPAAPKESPEESPKEDKPEEKEEEVEIESKEESKGSDEEEEEAMKLFGIRK